MASSETKSILDMVRAEFIRLVEEAGMGGAGVSVRARTLTPEEAIGTPERRDFPIVAGKERVIEAAVSGARAHAFTDSPGDFEGTLVSGNRFDVVTLVVAHGPETEKNPDHSRTFGSMSLLDDLTRTVEQAFRLGEVTQVDQEPSGVIGICSDVEVVWAPMLCDELAFTLERCFGGFQLTKCD